MIPVDRGEFRCPVCGSGRIGKTIHEEIAGFDMVQCGACGVMHLSPLPSEQTLREIYSQGYFKDEVERHGYFDYERDRPFVAATYERRFWRISRQIRPSRGEVHMHEVGCALGFGLEVGARLLGWNVSGSDISSYAVERTTTLGYPAVQCDPLGRCVPPGEAPNLICLFDVIEHLPRVDLFRAWLLEQLAPGGYVALTTMDMDSVWNRMLGRRSPSIKVPQHLTYFTRRTLERSMAPDFTLVHASPDLQTVSASLLVRRTLHILGLSSLRWAPLQSVPVAVPNGMKLYIFQRG